MMSAKGFLHQSSPTAWPRMTAEQKSEVLRAMNSVLDHANADLRVGPGEAPMLDWFELGLAREVVRMALDRYPVDRSCVTCDFYCGTTCVHWQAEVPAGAVDAGCDQHADSGAPF